jgi:hypothetical protein
LAHVELLVDHIKEARNHLEHVLSGSCTPDDRIREGIMLRELARLFPAKTDIQAVYKWFAEQIH